MAANGAALAQQDYRSSAAAIADRQEAEERYKRMNSAIEELLAANVAQQKRLAALAEEVQRLREELARSTQKQPGHASLDDLQRLTRKLQELDEKREADKKLILEELQKLSRMPAPGGERATAKPSANPVSAPKGDQKGYEYVVQPGDYLTTIVDAYRKQGVKVTLEQVVKANPKVQPQRLRPGQKIFIPDGNLN